MKKGLLAWVNCWRCLIVLMGCDCGLFYDAYIFNLWNKEEFSFHCVVLFFIWKTGFKPWEKGRQRQSLLQRSEWISSILSSAALSAIMAAVSNAACKHFLITCKGCDHVCACDFNMHPNSEDIDAYISVESIGFLLFCMLEYLIWSSFLGFFWQWHEELDRGSYLRDMPREL